MVFRKEMLHLVVRVHTLAYICQCIVDNILWTIMISSQDLHMC